MPRNVLPDVDLGLDDSQTDRALPKTPHSPAAPAPADEAYWRAHPDEFMQTLLAATGEAFAAK
ncbi:MAG TPA: hypothetical protein VGA00_01270 [Acidiferrobacterales bacterium]|jgi:hypothetical protein